LNRHRKCLNCGFVAYQDPKVAVCVIIEMEGKIVLMKRRIPTDAGDWAVPGGFVDAGEKVEDAAVREIREEVGLDVRIDELIGVYSRAGDPVVLIVYAGSAGGGVPDCGPEALEIMLVPYAEIPWEKLAFPANREALQDYYVLRSGQRR
jgi:ADP-ribose pyrophosphatase YjhB (NUDIX family)